MAIVVRNILLKGLQGSIGKTLVFRRCGNKTVVSLYPERSNKPPTEKQRRQRERFRRAVAYARDVVGDAGQRALYEGRVKKGQSVFQYAMREYLRFDV